jgi:hypothetical protein
MRFCRGLTAFGLVCGLTGVLLPAIARAEDPNDFAILLADPSVDAPPVLAHNVAEANATFDRRATRLLRFLACQPETTSPQGGGFRGVFNSDFATNLIDWAQDAVAKLAYRGPCGTTSAATRYHDVDIAMSQISIPSNLFEGTDIEPPISEGPFTIDRHGDLDFGLRQLVPILYLYKDKIPNAFNKILGLFRDRVAGSSPRPGNPPFVPLDLGGIATIFAPETENHSLAELSDQYLANQLVNQEAGASLVDNSQIHGYLLVFLQGILTSDFFEYNSKPYGSFDLYPIENLVDFAGDRDVRAGAQMVLDYASAKFAVGSSLLRRAAPYRRRGSADGNLFTGQHPDEQTCRFYLYSGELQAIANRQADDTIVYAAHTFCWGGVREAIGTYRVPDAILDMAFTPNVPYLQRFSGGNNYFASLFANVPGGNPVRGTLEIYDNEPTFMITAGGLPEPNGLPLVVAGLVVDLGPGFVHALDLPNGAGTVGYSITDEDVGISLPTLLVLNDPHDDSQPNDPNDPSHPNPGIRPIVDRDQLVRIEGTGHHGANLCVAPGFACGKNPTMPPLPSSRLVTDGPWQFADLPSSPVDTFVAMIAETAYLVTKQTGLVVPQPSAVVAPFTIGFFEAEPASQFADFAQFRARVKGNNPAGAGLIVEHNAFVANPGASEFVLPQPPCDIPNTPCFIVTGWSGQYQKTDGTIYNFNIPLDVKPEVFDNPSPFGDYPVSSPNAPLPAPDPTQWNLADGPVQATRTGVILITDPRNGQTCTLSFVDPEHPVRTGCEVACTPRCVQGFACVSGGDCASGVCVNGACNPPRCAPVCTAGAQCGSNQDCESGLCTNGVCQPPGTQATTCNGNQDCSSFVCKGAECHPPACSPTCSRGAPCGANTDCGSAVCDTGKGPSTSGRVCQPPACSPNCIDGQRCGDNGDCSSFMCQNNVCAPPSCAPTCARGAPCGSNGDCGSGVCRFGPPSQGILGFGDCAPPGCSPTCAEGSACGDNSDCASFICTSQRCAPPTCSPGCQRGAPCAANSDCASLRCASGSCQSK